MSTQDEDELREKLKDVTSVRHLHNQDMFNNPSCSGLNPAGIDALIRLTSSREQSIKKQAEREARIDEQTNHVMLGGNADCQGCYNAVMYNSDRLTALHSTNDSLEEK